VTLFSFTLIPMDATRCARSPILLEDSVLQTTCSGASPPDPLLAFFKINALKPYHHLVPDRSSLRHNHGASTHFPHTIATAPVS